MKSNDPEVPPSHPGGFDSRDCLVLIDDGPGDTTVRPCRPERLPILMAEREKILRWQNQLDQPEPPAND
jgi:hypothetical protein